MVLERDSKKQELLNSILKGKIKKDSEKSADAFVHLDQKEAPLSYAQNRMWFLHQFDDGDDSYNMHIVLKMDGELVKEALMYSISKIVERHEFRLQRFGFQSDRFAVELHEPASIDGGGDAAEIFVLQTFDNLDQQMCLGGKFGGGKPFGFAGGT